MIVRGKGIHSKKKGVGGEGIDKGIAVGKGSKAVA